MTDQKTWRVEVARSCIGSGLCLAVAPDHFEFSGARAKSTGVPIVGEDVSLVRIAVEVCPVAAISMSEE